MAKNINSADGSEVSGKIGPMRSPMCGNTVVPDKKMKLHPSTAANTTTPGIARSSAPIRSPMNGGAVVKY